MSGFAKLSWQPSALDGLGLPQAKYPIPISCFQNVLVGGRSVSAANLIAWTMDYLDEATEDRADYELLLLVIAERHAQPDAPSRIRLESRSEHRWSLWLGPVDVTGEIVTIEEGEHVLAAMQRAEPDRICACAYGAAGAYVSRHLLGYAQELEMGIFPIDSFEEAKGRTGRTANMYALLESSTHSVYWPHGLGWNVDGTFDGRYRNRLQPNPIPAAWLAFLLDVYDRAE